MQSLARLNTQCQELVSTGHQHMYMLMLDSCTGAHKDKYV